MEHSEGLRIWSCLIAMRRRVLRRQIFAIFACVVFTVFFTGRFLLVNNQDNKVPRVYLDLIPRVIPGFKILKKPVRRVFDVNCAAILAHDKQEIAKAMNISNSKGYRRKSIRDEDYIRLTENCDMFKLQRGYYDYNVTPEEEDFPLAFSILMYKEVEQAERLLRAIYRPQNVYCIHVDADSKHEVHAAVDGIANCFPNVFVVSRKEYIVYAGYSRLQADLNCMENLLQREKKWKYFLNLPSQEFPIKTNAELVKILKVYNGSNDIEGIRGDRMLARRIKFRYFYRHSKDRAKPSIIKTNQEKDRPPYNITMTKGSAYGVFSRKFVEYTIENKIARALLDYMRDVLSPDEYYWATLNHNPHIGAPGSYKGDPMGKDWLAVYASWGGQCAGKYVRGVCVFGVGDLSSLVTRHELFVNKFYLDYQPFALDCMEEWYFNRSLSDSGSKLNLTFYQSLPFIQR